MTTIGPFMLQRPSPFAPEGRGDPLLRLTRGGLATRASIVLRLLARPVDGAPAISPLAAVLLVPALLDLDARR